MSESSSSPEIDDEKKNVSLGDAPVMSRIKIDEHIVTLSLDMSEE